MSTFRLPGECPLLVGKPTSSAQLLSEKAAAPWNDLGVFVNANNGSNPPPFGTDRITSIRSKYLYMKLTEVTGHRSLLMLLGFLS